MTDVKWFKTDVAAFLGWSSPNHVAAAQKRTRDGVANVPFPPPDGWQVLEPRRNGHDRIPWWHKATIERYAAQVRQRGGRGVPVTPEQEQRIWRLRNIDGLTHEQIAARVGVRRRTVARHLANPVYTTEEN